MSTARIPDGTPQGLVQMGLASYGIESICANADMSTIPQEGRSDPPVKPTSEVAHQPGQQPAAASYPVTINCSTWGLQRALADFARSGELTDVLWRWMSRHGYNA